MHRTRTSATLLASASLFGLMGIAPLWAQSTAPRVNDNAAQETIKRSEDDAVLKVLKKRSKSKTSSVNADEAEKTLGTDQGGALLDQLPSEEKLDALAAAMAAEPNNLDYYFTYAQMATTLGHHDKAATAYEAMLKLMPDLDRVRLDLGVAYMRLNRLEEARTEMNTVLSHNPPEAVRGNIESIVAQLDTALSEHGWDGSLSVGMNADSNANSAPSSDRILIFDTPILLNAEQREQQDLQLFTAASLNYSYRPLWARGQSWSAQWKSTASVYSAEQSSLENLDLKVLSVKTGPELRHGASGFTLSPALSHTHIELDTSPYLRSTALELDADYPLSERWLLSGGLKHEFRNFENAPGITVYEDRTGSASEAQLGLRYAVTDKDSISLQTTHRRERTREEYYDNEQLGANLSYTRLFNEYWFANATAGYKNTVYDNHDALISGNTRHDKEKSAGLTIGRKLTDSITATAGYQYRDTESNILNYDYDNHRVTTALSLRF